MKILCDVCGKGEASLYCTADEASLCASCDHRVHHANKLAGKHQRFSLLQPSPKHSPLCDICQERSAFLFCQEDRAILCRECDVPIHKANQHTQKHTRFLLTGVTLSASPMPESPPPQAKGTSTTPTPAAQEPFSTTSSISEYLIETLPGWHVEDLLDSSTPSPSPFCKGNDLVLPFWDDDLHCGSICTSGFPTENLGIWVPQVQVHQNQNQNPNPNPNQSFLVNSSNNNNVGFGVGINANGCRDSFIEFSTNGIKSNRKRSDVDNSFAVPQISPSAAAAFNKISKTFW
ncbi:B-box zinc finger protein 21-like isoform X2 [Salvia splendens]|uniref:B-box zinc finger protein 21-like isoform X2 n=1 Tax=Salvia splendens TaxID=180675 RepID=UPI001C27A195|nr:B-box zinc finger protein 21-like isoform X2 [Salvia splendens]